MPSSSLVNRSELPLTIDSIAGQGRYQGTQKASSSFASSDSVMPQSASFRVGGGGSATSGVALNAGWGAFAFVDLTGCLRLAAIFCTSIVEHWIVGLRRSGLADTAYRNITYGYALGARAIAFPPPVDAPALTTASESQGKLLPKWIRSGVTRRRNAARVIGLAAPAVS